MTKSGVYIPLALTLGIQSIVSMVAVTVPVLAPSAAPDIGTSATLVGLYVSLMYVGSMVSSLWSGDFIVRYGALRVSQICLVLAGCGLMLTALASIPALILSALVIGVGYGPVTPASSHILARRSPARMMSFIFSLKQTGVPLGGVLAGAIVPSLVLLAGWKYAAVLIGAFCVCLAPLLAPVRSTIDGDRQPHRKVSISGVIRPLAMVLSHPPLRRLSIISFLYAGMQLCLFTYLVVFLTDDIGLALVTAGFILSAAQMAGTIGRIVWGLLADQLIPPLLLLGLLGVGMSIGSVATALIRPEWSRGSSFLSSSCSVLPPSAGTAFTWPKQQDGHHPEKPARQRGGRCFSPSSESCSVPPFLRQLHRAPTATLWALSALPCSPCSAAPAQPCHTGRNNDSGRRC